MPPRSPAGPAGASAASGGQAAPPTILLPHGYTLRRLLADTHFSAVWEGAAPGPAGGHSARRGADGQGQGPGLGPQDEAVVIKALDARRPTHAAAAANEAAALRHVAATMGSSVADTHAAAEQALPPPPPFVRLLDTFTSTVAALRPAGGDKLEALDTAAGGASGAAPARFRCLVMERLGPTASDVLYVWQQRWAAGRAEPPPPPQQQRSAQRKRSGDRAAQQPQAQQPWCGGLPPSIVRSFASQALEALDALHRRALLVHGDVKPDNFAARQLRAAQGQPGGGVQHGAHDGPDGNARPRWAVLDMGSACSLVHGGQKVDVAGAPTGHVRPCTPPLPEIGRSACSTGGSDGSTHDAAAAAAWYDTPSFAAPELTLGLPPSPASDMWSLGATVFELATGTRLLPMPAALFEAGRRAAGSGQGRRAAWAAGASGSDDDGGPDASEVHLALVVQLLGPPPAALLARAPRAHWFFDVPRCTLLALEDGEEGYRYGAGRGGGSALPRRGLSMRLRQCAARQAAWAAQHNSGGGVTRLDGGQGAWAHVPEAREGGAGDALAWAWAEEGQHAWDAHEWAGLHSFLRPLLRWDPLDRPAAHAAGQHPWLRGEGRG